MNQADEVKEVADRVALENVGAPSVFAVAEAVKEWLVDNNIAGQDGSMYSGMHRLPFFLLECASLFHYIILFFGQFRNDAKDAAERYAT